MDIYYVLHLVADQEQPGPIFSGSSSDYWVPLNWLDLDNRDRDLGGSGPLLVDVPGATPSSLVVAAGVWSAILPTNAPVNVTRYHTHIEWVAALHRQK
jgi:hypothetical protein